MLAQNGNMKAVAWAMAALVGVGLAIVLLGPPKINERRQELWKQSLDTAEKARAKGDHYGALDAYTYAAQMASSVDDWRGLLAVACGLQKLGGGEGPSIYGFQVIMTAMTAAERRRSTEGMQAVADAFASLGDSYASFALSRVRDDWPESGAANGAGGYRRKSATAEVR